MSEGRNTLLSIINNTDINETWNMLREFTSIEDLIKDCSARQKNGITFLSSTPECQNSVYCFYRTPNGYVVPLGTLKSISIVKKSNRSYKLAFKEIPELKSFDELEIEISENNIQSRLRYLKIDNTSLIPSENPTTPSTTPRPSFLSRLGLDPQNRARVSPEEDQTSYRNETTNPMYPNVDTNNAYDANQNNPTWMNERNDRQNPHPVQPQSPTSTYTENNPPWLYPGNDSMTENPMNKRGNRNVKAGGKRKTKRRLNKSKNTKKKYSLRKK
jgi:hypothetical protein